MAVLSCPPELPASAKSTSSCSAADPANSQDDNQPLPPDPPPPILCVFAHDVAAFQCPACAFSSKHFADLRHHRACCHRGTTFDDRFHGSERMRSIRTTRVAAAKHSSLCKSETTPATTQSPVDPAPWSPLGASPNVTVTPSLRRPSPTSYKTCGSKRRRLSDSDEDPHLLRLPRRQPRKFSCWAPAHARIRSPTSAPPKPTSSTAASLLLVPALPPDLPAFIAAISNRIAQESPIETNSTEDEATAHPCSSPTSLMTAAAESSTTPDHTMATEDEPTMNAPRVDGPPCFALPIPVLLGPVLALPHRADAQMGASTEPTGGKWTLRFDGACRRNPGPAGAGAALFDGANKCVSSASDAFVMGEKRQL